MSTATLPETGLLVVISGPSGVGKTVVTQRLLEQYQCERAVTATTRDPRPGEVDGVDYYFYSGDAFRADLERGLFLEHAEVYGNLYGTPVRSVAEILDRDAICVLNIDVQGATELMDRETRGLYCFLEPPSLEILKERLMRRGTEDPDMLRRRLEACDRELACRTRYGVRIVNENLEETVRELADRIGLDPRAS